MKSTAAQAGQAAIIILVLALVGVLSGVGYYFWASRSTAPTSSPIIRPSTLVTTPVQSIRPVATPVATGPITFSGTVLAGSTAPLLDFNQADYQKALNSDKLIVLYFYADWCPICRAEFPLMQAAFNQLTLTNVVGFRVNYNDTSTDEAEKSLAREHGVAYQHTKVFVKNGQRLSKSPESWTQDRYVADITAAAR